MARTLKWTPITRGYPLSDRATRPRVITVQTEKQKQAIAVPAKRNLKRNEKQFSTLSGDSRFFVCELLDINVQQRGVEGSSFGDRKNVWVSLTSNNRLRRWACCAPTVGV
eukprot:3025122-Pyramimonas_sp.AAC.1